VHQVGCVRRSLPVRAAGVVSASRSLNSLWPGFDVARARNPEEATAWRSTRSLPIDEMVRLDLAYVETWTLEQDVRIVLKTVPAVLFGKAY